MLVLFDCLLPLFGVCSMEIIDEFFDSVKPLKETACQTTKLRA